MESALRTKIPSPFPQAPPAAHHQPPRLPLPAQAPSSQHSFCPASCRPVPPNPRVALPAGPGPSAPITVAALPSKRRVAPAPAEEGGVERAAETDSLYSVSPPPCCVPMPTSLLAAVKAPCAVEVVAGAGGAVDVGATDDLRRLLRL